MWPHSEVDRLALAAAVLTTLTTVREAASMTYASLEYSNWYWQARGRPIPPHVAPLLRDA